ncbi:ABC transporter permease [Parabacteroides sp. PF5-9]|uniref:ABC transporter permease n=1 Tax=Parabacteroides sp. PF5-9 TaxID=1742404 RepID=UPI0024768B99|nr:ABC transporter permease [Parabacteroides sp. PF5-9]MDH6357816.1 putative ABC transport system permease protein [Parabacteroides sp. PF5-9]
MIQLYFKQAWNRLRQEKVFSFIYVIGTGLSITVVMVLAIVIYMKIANVYPETNRDRMLIVQYAGVKAENGSVGTSRLSLDVIRQCIYPLQTAEAVSAVYGYWGGNAVQPEGSDEQMSASVKYVDTGYWNVFSFNFIEGAPFTEADMESGIRTVVISESYARKVFGTTEVTSKFISLNFDPYRICGVVKDPSYIADKTFAQLWMPYSAYPGLQPAWQTDWYKNTLGSFIAYILAPSEKDIEKVKQEISENFRRYASSLDGLTFTIHGQPDRQWQSLFRLSSRLTIDFTQIKLQYLALFFLLLFIPAVSLSGMADSQMGCRLEEMGLRRAFGARSGGLMKQLIVENMLLTFLGGILGLLFSYLFVYFFRRWIIHIGTGQKFVNAVPEGIDVAISPSMMMNFTVFGIALGICLLLNLMVTAIPAWRASRREIVYSLSSK